MCPSPRGAGRLPLLSFSSVLTAHTRAHTHTHTHAFSKPAGNHKKLSLSLGTAKDASVYLTGSLLFLPFSSLSLTFLLDRTPV